MNEMEHQQNGQTARDFLEASDREFADGDRLQASEKLWGAASHAVMAVALQRDWPCRSHRALRNAVERLSHETGQEHLQAGFSIAEKFHRNFYHDEMPDYETTSDRPLVWSFVDRMLALAENGAG